jgi:capsular exopolysaccharide synthesis family protein
MLDRISNSRPPDHDDADGLAPGEQTFLSFKEISLFLKRYFATVAVAVLAAMLLAGAYAFTATPLYTSRAQLLIDPKLPTVLREQTGDASSPLDSPQVESQIVVLRSEEIALTVINKLKLRDEPEFARPTPGVLGHLLSLVSVRAPHPPARPRTRAEAEQIAISTFLSRLDVRREGMSHAIDIYFTSEHPDLAAAIANAIAEAYVSDQLQTRASTVRQGTEWLEDRIEQIRARMNAAALMVQEFKAKRDYRIKRDNEGDTASARDHDKPEANTLDELESKALAYRKIYENLIQTYAQTVELQSFPVANARVISKATSPPSKSHPRTFLILLAGFGVGGLLGFGIAGLRHSLDRSLRSAGQVRAAVGLECLGLLPLLERRRLLPMMRANTPASTGRSPGRGSATSRLTEVQEAPFSRFTDGVKRVKTAISLTIKANPIRCIGLSSAMPGEGKSTLAANLAGIYASSGQRILLIDADLHNSSLSRGFAPKARAGLVEVLTGLAPAEQCIVTCRDGLDILPVVKVHRLAHANNLLSSERMRTLLRDQLEAYDTVIVDLPPVGPVVDALAMSSLLDGVVLVAEWGRTTVGGLSETARALRMARATILGVVLTKVASNAMDEYGSRALGRYY